MKCNWLYNLYGKWWNVQKSLDQGEEDGLVSNKNKMKLMYLFKKVPPLNKCHMAVILVSIALNKCYTPEKQCSAYLKHLNFQSDAYSMRLSPTELLDSNMDT